MCLIIKSALHKGSTDTAVDAGSNVSSIILNSHVTTLLLWQMCNIFHHHRSSLLVWLTETGTWCFACYQASPAYLVLWLAPRQTRCTSGGGRSIRGFALETLVVWCVWFEHAKQFWCCLWNVPKKRTEKGKKKKNANQSKSNPIALGRKLI